MSVSVSKQTKSPFDAIPQFTTSSILSYVTSNDWLNFRLVSRGCYQIVHGTNVANMYDIATVDGGGRSESEVLWRLALVREYQFDESEKDEELFYQCIEQNEYEDDDDAFLRTDDMFRAPNLFIAWKNWRKIDLRIHCKRNDLYVEPKMRGYALKESERVKNASFQLDSLLRWFEEHANRLQKGFLSVGKIDRFDSIVRYPTVADTANCSRAVTRGVEVVASSIYVPEMSMHVYSIRIRLLTPDDGDEYMSPEQRGFETCQLVSRYWKISMKGPRRGPRGAEPQPVIQEVRGEGVIGMYPLLFEGGFRNYETGEDGELEEGDDTNGQFSYQSCTQAESPNHSGSILIEED